MGFFPSREIQCGMVKNTPEGWRLESRKNEEGEQLEGGGGGQHPRLVDALHLTMFQQSNTHSWQSFVSISNNV